MTRIIFSCFILGSIHASSSSLKEMEIDWRMIDKLAIPETLRSETIETSRTRTLFVKYLIIKGDLKEALRIINKKKDKKLWADILFLQGSFKKSLQVLQELPFKEHCFLNVVLQLLVPLTNNLQMSFERCFLMEGGGEWIKKLVDLKMQRKRPLSFKSKNFTPDQFQQWLKLRIYMGRERELLKYLKYIPVKFYTFSQITDLISLIYYRTKHYGKALETISNSRSSYANNLKGILYLKKKKYTTAYKYFSKALKVRSNSIFALEKIIFLAYKLKRWKDGMKILAHRNVDHFLIKNNLAWKTIFSIKNDQMKAANNYFLRWMSYDPPESSTKIEILKSYFAFLNGDDKQFQISSSRLCSKFDGASCSLQFHRASTLIEWKGIATDRSLAIENLKKSQKFDPILELSLFDETDVDVHDKKEKI